MMFRFNMRPRYAARDAQPAGDLVRYLQREGEFAPKEKAEDRDVAYMTRTRADTLPHADLVGEPITRNLPAWAQGDAGRYFQAASAHEWTKGPYAMAFQIALPRELTHAQQMALADDIVATLMPDKPVLMVKHEPVSKEEPQPHLHILMGLRSVDGIARDEVQTFRRYNPDYPERGGAPKDRFWNQRQAPRQVRDALADLVNVHAEYAGIPDRIDPRSLRKQGLDRERISWSNPQPLDPATKAAEQAKAQDAWERRKGYRGYTLDALDHGAVLDRIRAGMRTYARGEAVPRSTVADLQAEQARHAARVAQQEAYAAQLQAAIDGKLATAQLLRLLARGEDYDAPRRGGYRVKLHEETHGYGH